ncbi:OLC1v1021463C1 [Oldenlandia corymbosa var. corymbosa]|uniref:OLC1v1021463C1 n=1 Tax=Oldenlandia corymbosa var. corymbosa TaxID=529605 RepID=A0AAV1BY02_OLDCO|nr:OLC1v1021463C1 [Oldenlandia corymbosa var. corymbosa]
MEVNGAEDTMITEPERVFHETPCGKGLGNTLMVVRDRGWLKGNREVHDDEGSSDEVETAKRRKDNSSSVPKTKGRYNFKDLQIVRRDGQGRELTPKEAYRQLCHVFHGKSPSKKTVEKRERQQQMKTDKPTVTQDLLALERSLKVAQSPYVVISAGERKKSRLHACYRVYTKVRLYPASQTLIPTI